MKLTAQIKLVPTSDQADVLKKTLETANAACNHISNQAWDHRTFRQYPLHNLTYHETRELFSLSAQAVVRCISKVADAYKADRKAKRSFRKHGAITFDNRLLTYNLEKMTVSIWTIEGRQQIPFTCGKRQMEFLLTQRGESDLCYIGKSFYLFATCHIEEPTPLDVEGMLGIDMGIVNIAVDSDGEIHSGSHINNVRRRHRRLRKKLQSKGTRSAKRKLKKLSGKERRFAKNVNHCVSKHIVEKAKDTNRGIAMEELKGIRDRVTVRRCQRSTLHSWSFFQLRAFIEYKARREGVPVIPVDPRNTSRTCPMCDYISKQNRPSQSVFKCVNCGHAGLADHIAAENIRRAAVNPPNVALQWAFSPPLQLQATGVQPVGN